jgi:hypothetical protein
MNQTDKGEILKQLREIEERAYSLADECTEIGSEVGEARKRIAHLESETENKEGEDK